MVQRAQHENAIATISGDLGWSNGDADAMSQTKSYKRQDRYERNENGIAYPGISTLSRGKDILSSFEATYGL